MSYNICTLGRVDYWAKGCEDIGSFLVQAPPGSWPGLGAQHCYETPNAPLAKSWRNTVINIGCVRPFPRAQNWMWAAK